MIHRLVQTYRHLLAAPDDRLISDVPPEHRAMIAALSRADRRHALATYAKLRARRADDELCAAGLLHDVGKPPNVRLWHRVAGVLAPAVARRVGGATMRAYLDHPARSAAVLRQRGASERVVRLVARHHDAPRGDDERALAAADRE